MLNCGQHQRRVGSRERILGLDFFTGTLAEACAEAESGGLVVAPAAPGLAHDLVESPAYRAALLASDVVLTDSGFLVLLWQVFTGKRLPRHSGLKFLRHFLKTNTAHRPGAFFWVMPDEETCARNLRWLRAQGLPVEEEDCYVAPHYGSGEISDERLVAILEQRRPAAVVLAIGGGVQERLGHALSRRLSWRPGILCLGAAIAFLSGAQVAIPGWVDRFMLGWLWRIASAPHRYVPRYVRATRLAWLVFRHRRFLPVGPT